EDFTLDLFTAMRSRTFGDFRADARSLRVEGVPILYLAPESLIELKSLALREIMSGKAPPSPADLVELTPRSDSQPEDAP
ncbi:MAG TPA: hypothetical protein VF551_00155, partial [Chthoniobacterales bacterium]